MAKRLIIFLAFLFLLSAPVNAAPPNFSQSEIIVKFKDTVSDEQAEKISQGFGAQVSKKNLLPQIFTVKVPDKQIDKMVQVFNRNPFVEYAEPDYQVDALELTSVPNDQYFSNQWGMVKAQFPQAWDINKGSSHSLIAILDTGIDRDHEDLKNKVDQWVNFTSSSDDDLYGHGTHVAGIAASETNNGIGVAGSGYNSHLLSVKVLDDNGSGYYSWVIQGIRWAADNNAKVINLSLGASSRSKALEAAINYASEKGLVLSCAAGNSGNKSPTYPAYYKNCIAVAATDENDRKTSFSSFGSWVDVAAPGLNIFSTFPNHPYKINKSLGYGYASGTSMATPHVAGLAGLLFGIDPQLTAQEVRGLIEDNVDKISGTGTYWVKGRINAFRSVVDIPSIALPSPSLLPTPVLLPATPVATSSVTQIVSSAIISKPWWCNLMSSLCAREESL